ncbi:MAG: transposase [Holophagales bacterium]|jgi:transposase|nr:transposase [Holophagales bacterium]
MGYSVDFREKVMEFLDRGNTMSKAGEVFGISVFTVNRWRQKLKNTGELKDEPRRVKFKKIDPHKLKEYVKKHPDAYLKEIGEAFSCSAVAVLKAFRKLNITRKKKPKDSGRKRKSRYSAEF